MVCCWDLLVCFGGDGIVGCECVVGGEVCVVCGNGELCEIDCGGVGECGE